MRAPARTAPTPLAWHRRTDPVAVAAAAPAVVALQSPGTQPGPPDEDLAARVARKEAKIRAESARPLDPWERYRALVDAIDEALKLTELADRKVRFALVVMAGLNLGVFAVVTRPELSGLQAGPWFAPWAVAYALLTVWLLLQAVEALRPREEPEPQRSDPRARGDVLRDGLADSGSREELEQAWREVRFDELTGALVARVHGLACCNRQKFKALRRLYAGLRVMAAMVAALVALAAVSALLPAPPA